MIQIYYMTAFVLSLMLTAFYVFVWRRRYEVNITVLFLLIPIMNFAFLECFNEPDLQINLFALKILYIGACFFPWFLTLCVLNLCGIKLGYRGRFLSFALSALIYCSVLTIGQEGSWFYKSIHMEFRDNVWVPVKVYGFMHTLYYISLVLYSGFSIAAIIHTWLRKKQVSRKILHMLFFPHLVTLAGHLVKGLLPTGVELVPVCYVYAQCVYLLIVHRMELHHVSDMAIETMIRSGDVGFISLDEGYHYLGSNETARRVVPELEQIPVDESIVGVEGLDRNVLHWLVQFKEDEANGKNLCRIKSPENSEEEEVYRVEIRYLYDGTRRRGYQIFLTNDTQNQKYIRLLDQYKTELEEEVSRKTAHIERMHDNLILSMATMVESRDNSTGGHIRRTSVCMRILIDEILKLGEPVLTEEFCRNIIKAAPMHDLGKIAVDDAILRKPGRFTPEEYEIMKKHAEEGARIVHEILKDTDDEAFHLLAENVAHYHHERWDGSGYPQGLKGEEIPLEARIMAIADVYDALVSKRVYKERMSFSEADRILTEGMGKHFDPQLQEAYNRARPRLEEYYRINDSEDGPAERKAGKKE